METHARSRELATLATTYMLRTPQPLPSAAHLLGHTYTQGQAKPGRPLILLHTYQVAVYVHRCRTTPRPEECSSLYGPPQPADRFAPAL